eukprot:scaffold9.g3299.t1
MAATPRDPFYIVRDDVAETLRGVQDKYGRWQNLPRGNADRRGLEGELGDECSSLQYMVDEIDKSIDAAEKNPQRFRLSQQELSDRRKWVMSMRRQIDAVTGGLRAGPSGAPPPATAASKLAAAAAEENERFIASEGDRQQLLMRRQDDELDQLSTHVVRIGELGKEMGQELHLQGQLLDELDNEVEGTQGRLAAAQRKVEYVLQKAGVRGQIMLILGLVGLLVILILLVFS